MDQATAPTGTEMQTSATGVPLFALDRPDEHFPAYFCQKNGDYLLFRTRQELAPGRRLVTIDQGLRVEIEVVYRQERADGTFDIGCKAVATGKGSIRREWRIPVDLPAAITASGSEISYQGRVLNLSTVGLGLQLPIEVTSGSEIVVQMDGGVGFGQVRHCRRVNQDTYMVGVYLDNFVESDQKTDKQKEAIRPNWLSRGVSAIRFWKARG